MPQKLELRKTFEAEESERAVNLMNRAYADASIILPIRELSQDIELSYLNARAVIDDVIPSYLGLKAPKKIGLALARAYLRDFYFDLGMDEEEMEELVAFSLYLHELLGISVYLAKARRNSKKTIRQNT